MLNPVTRIRSITLRTTSLTDARRAMHAACAPFGSLSVEIADLAIEYLAGPSRTGYGADYADGASCSIDAGIALLRATRAVTDAEPVAPAATEWSEVLLGGSRVQLITPTSGTIIELRYAGRSWQISVDFGPAGSNHRADQILERDTAEPTLEWQVAPVESAANTTTIVQTDPDPDGSTMTVGTGPAKEMPAGLAEELAAMAPEDRAVAQRVSDLGEIEPAPGWEERAIERAPQAGRVGARRLPLAAPLSRHGAGTTNRREERREGLRP